MTQIDQFREAFSDNWNNCNCFRKEALILIKKPLNGGFIIYDTLNKKWSDDSYKDLEYSPHELTFCQPKKYVFRNSYLGDYIDRYYTPNLMVHDLIFLFPEYEFIVEQAIKLNVPFILNAFRNGDTLCLKRTHNVTSLVKATEMSAKQLALFQERIQKAKENTLYYFTRLSMMVESFKGLQDDVFMKLLDITLNDTLSNNALSVYGNLILSKKGGINQKLDKIKSYIENNFMDYRIAWESIDRMGKLDKSEFPELPKASDLPNLIPVIQGKLKVYEDEEYYKELNEKYSSLIEGLKKFEFSDNDYCIVLPKEVQELDIEGNVLHHCVGSYKDNIANGKEIILFLRKMNDLKTPFYTIDLDEEGFIRQIHTKYNGNIQDDAEKDKIIAFLESWANNKSNLINKKSIKLSYGALANL